MIYDFEKNTPQIHPDSWVASNAVIIGKVTLEKRQLKVGILRGS